MRLFAYECHDPCVSRDRQQIGTLCDLSIVSCFDNCLRIWFWRTMSPTISPPQSSIQIKTVEWVDLLAWNDWNYRDAAVHALTTGKEMAVGWNGACWWPRMNGELQWMSPRFIPPKYYWCFHFFYQVFTTCTEWSRAPMFSACLWWGKIYLCTVVHHVLVLMGERLNVLTVCPAS